MTTLNGSKADSADPTVPRCYGVDVRVSAPARRGALWCGQLVAKKGKIAHFPAWLAVAEDDASTKVVENLEKSKVTSLPHRATLRHHPSLTPTQNAPFGAPTCCRLHRI